jgi:hypothetical protein
MPSQGGFVVFVVLQLPLLFVWGAVGFVAWGVGRKSSPKRDHQPHQGSVAAMVPCHLWNTSITAVTWAVQWKPNKGLMPIRPQVMFSDGGSLPAKQAFVITK